MHFYKLFSIAAGVSLAAAAPGISPASPLIEKRQKGCNANNCLRDLRNARFSASASVYCSSLIQPISYSTTVVTSTVYTAASTITPLATTIATSVVIQPATATSTTKTGAAPAKRALVVPSYASHCNAASMTSACSCLLTATPPSVKTITSTSIVSTTLPSTVTVPTSTLTSTTEVTSTSTTVVVSTSAASPLICGARGTPGSKANQVSSFSSGGGAASCKQYCPGYDGRTTSVRRVDSIGMCYCYADSVANSYVTDSNAAGVWYDLGCSL